MALKEPEITDLTMQEEEEDDDEGSSKGPEEGEGDQGSNKPEAQDSDSADPEELTVSPMSCKRNQDVSFLLI